MPLPMVSVASDIGDLGIQRVADRAAKRHRAGTGQCLVPSKYSRP